MKIRDSVLWFQIKYYIYVVVVTFIVANVAVETSPVSASCKTFYNGTPIVTCPFPPSGGVILQYANTSTHKKGPAYSCQWRRIFPECTGFDGFTLFNNTTDANSVTFKIPLEHTTWLFSCIHTPFSNTSQNCRFDNQPVNRPAASVTSVNRPDAPVISANGPDVSVTSVSDKPLCAPHNNNTGREAYDSLREEIASNFKSSTGWHAGIIFAVFVLTILIIIVLVVVCLRKSPKPLTRSRRDEGSRQPIYLRTTRETEA